MTTTNWFVIANVKQLRTGGSFRILLPFFRTYWGVGVLNSAIFNSFQNRVNFGTILDGLQNFWGWRIWTPPPQPALLVHQCLTLYIFHISHIHPGTFRSIGGQRISIHSPACLPTCFFVPLWIYVIMQKMLINLHGKKKKRKSVQ